jgi:integrase
VSAASILRQAKSVFARWTVAYYRQAGIDLPDSVERFLRTGKAHKPGRYQLPPVDLIAATHAAAGKLGPPLRLAYLLCYRFGLRAGEAAAARWSWIEQDAKGQRVLRVCRRADWKGAKNMVDHSIPATPDTWAELGRLRGSGVHILPGATPNARYALVTKDLAVWMRDTGWTAATYPKAAHELRKLAGSMWLTQAGPQWAAEWLGDSVATVLHYYARMMGSGTAVRM